ncbi:RidA family protein [Pusillimonas sp.]|uniref:RidA family protein n=1 Tax=Pusillimonas sp. TaxID=3040095 RepID=UPI0037C52558
MKQAYNPTDPQFLTSDGKQTIFECFGYSAAVRGGDYIYISGQIGLAPDGSIPEDVEVQIRCAFERLGLVLAGAGVGFDDLIELVSYHVGLADQLAQFTQIKREYVSEEPAPAWTILEVAGLARPGLVVEIKAVAYAPRN